jgi:hypothetical protein
MSIFEAVTRGELTPEQGAVLMMKERDTMTKAILKKIWAFIQTLNRSKVVNGIGAFFALVIPVLLVVVKGLPPAWSVTLLLASAVGVLARAQYIWQQVIPLLDGSSVVQVKPPTNSGQAALVSVAMDPSQVASNRASVIPSSQLDDTAIHGVPATDADDVITGTIRPPRGVVIVPPKPVPRDPTKT